MLSRRILAAALASLLLPAIPARAAAIRVLPAKGDAEVMKEDGGESATLAAGAASGDSTPQGTILDVEIGQNGASETGASIHIVVDDGVNDNVEAIYTADIPPPVP